MSKKIPLTQGKFAIVDDDDFGSLSNHKWHISAQGYAVRFKNRSAILMHKFLNNTPSGLDTDHINGNKLDNRRSNLRSCSRSNNLGNSSKHRDSKSRYKGVYWNSTNKKWIAQLRKSGVRVYQKSFASEEAAAIAYNTAALKHFGKFSKLNNI